MPNPRDARAVLDRPLSRREMKRQMKENGEVRGVVRVDLSDAVDHDLEGFLDLLSDRLTGTEVLSDFSYRVVGHDGDELHVEVAGDASLVLN